MPQTPDRSPGEDLEEGIIFDRRDPGDVPVADGGLRYVDGSFLAKDDLGVFNVRQISETDHAALRQLIHLADGVGGPMEGYTSGAYRETLPTASIFPTTIIWWTDSSKTTKVVQKTITYTGILPTMIRWSMYDLPGTTVIHEVTDNISYSGIFETSRTRTVT
jgi:hypothetical protein